MITIEEYKSFNAFEKEAYLSLHPNFKDEIDKVKTFSRFDWLSPLWIYPEEKDIMRANGLTSPAKARSMANKITDPEKMIRRTKAVVNRWGRRDDRTEAFIEAMRNLGFDEKQIEETLSL